MSEGILINKTSGTGFISYALVRVLAPTGSDVTLTSYTNISKTITSNKAKPLASNANFSVYYFNIGTAEFGNATIVGLHEGYTMTQTINITNNVEYTVELQHRLPSGYQEVEYIRLSKKAYINTGKCFTSAVNYTFDIIISLESLTSQEAWTIMSPHGTNRGKFMVNTSGQIYLADYGAGSSIAGQIIPNQWHHIIINEDSNLKIAVDGAVSPTNYAATYFQGSSSNYLLNCRYIQADGAYTSFDMKWKQFKVKEITSGNYICDLVPCIRVSDNTPGLYDLYGGTFLTNVGAGSITAG